MKRIFGYLLLILILAGAVTFFQSCIFGKEAPKSYGSESKTYKSQKKSLDKTRSNKKVKRQDRESNYVSPVD